MDDLANPVPTGLLNGEGKALKNATSTIAAPMTAAQVSLLVTSAAGFPIIAATMPFIVKVDDELMWVSSVAGATFTVVRGFNGTTAAAHLAGAAIVQEPYFLFFQPYPAIAFAPLSLP
jgi:hypothetical protein